MSTVLKTFGLPLIIFIAIITIGTLGYMHFDSLSLVDSLHVVAVTLATCGLRPTNETFSGKIFDIVFIVFGFTVMIAVVGRSFSMVIEGQITGIRQKDKIKKMLNKMKNHYIICGYGRVGKQVSLQLMEKKIPIIIIDSDPNAEEKLKEEKVPYIIGSLSSDDILRQAHIERAQGLVACADSDVENVFVTLSARTLNPGLKIIARASDIVNEKKMKHAGADHVISPYLTAGQRISSMILQPAVADFVDYAMHNQAIEIWFQEVKLPKNSKIAGKTIQMINLRKKTGIVILAIKHSDGTMDLTPSADTVINNEDVLICIGNTQQIKEFKDLL